jgi:Diacylglycerol acyltransferase
MAMMWCVCVCLSDSVLFRIPLLRDLLLALGCVDASSSTCHRILKAGLSLQLYPGGEREMLLTPSAPSALVSSSSSSSSSSTAPPFTSIIVASSRRGFVRLALQYSLPILPCFCFGEDQLFHTSTFLLPLRLRLASVLRVALPLFMGRWWFAAMPLQREVVMVVGKPLMIGGEGVGEKRVEEGVRMYCDAMRSMFDRHKGSVAGYEKAQLQIL